MAAPTYELRVASSSARYLVNPFANSFPAIAALVNEKWIFDHITLLAGRICERAIKLEEFEKGPYTGISGTAYALIRTSEALGRQAEQNYADYVNGLLNHIAKRKLSSRRLGRYLTGSIGDYVVQAICLHKLGSPENAILTKLKAEATEILGKDNEDEILNGRAGYLAGLLTLKCDIGVNLLDNWDIKQILDAMIRSGREYSQKSKAQANLMYEWHNSEYLGAAHGLSGILQMLLTYWRQLEKDQQRDVKQTVDWFLGIQDSIGNFPSSTERIGQSRGEDELVHWCHGATGAIHMLIMAYMVFGEEKYMKSAKKCAELIWQRGLLRKGPGICHGVAGSGYAFLLLYRLTNNLEYLQKAKAFAYFMMDPRFEKNATTPDMPWSLYEGWSGSLCFLVDLFKPDRAQFPLVPIQFAT